MATVNRSTQPWEAPARRRAAWRARGLGLLVLAGLVTLGGCAEPVYRKRTFMDQGASSEAPASLPLGLNPLGSLDTCQPSAEPRPTQALVLVSRPEYFTAEASRMILALRDELAQPAPGVPTAEFQLSTRPIRSTEQAVLAGLGCGALIVLWEPGLTGTLQLTVPRPAEIPLRALPHDNLCEFGNHREQLRILYLTIAGLLAMRENDLERAVIYLDAAERIDDHCLHLPGSLPPPADEVPPAGTGGRGAGAGQP